MAILSTHNLSVGYSHKNKKTTVLDSLDLKLNEGEVVCLIGANGQGKSTLLRTLAGVLPPLCGDIVISNRNLKSISKHDLAKMLGLVYTDRTQVGALTVEELVALGRQPHTGFLGRLSESDKSVVTYSMQCTGIVHKRYSLMAQLSDGERQKAMIAKALAQETPIIFLDEPTAFLDVASKIETMQLLHDLASSQKKAILLSTHDISQALMLADKLWIITGNHKLIAGFTEDLILQGTLNELFESGNIVFDSITGSFGNNKPAHTTVTLLDGDDATRHWCENALRRNGVGISDFSETSIKPIASNDIQIYTGGNVAKICTSIESMVNEILHLENLNHGNK